MSYELLTFTLLDLVNHMMGTSYTMMGSWWLILPTVGVTLTFIDGTYAYFKIDTGMFSWLADDFNFVIDNPIGYIGYVLGTALTMAVLSCLAIPIIYGLAAFIPLTIIVPMLTILTCAAIINHYHKGVK